MRFKRASNPKTRTGCQTCKKRRVKCDETKPSCNRCGSAKRVCGGYGIVLDSPKRPAYESIDGLYMQHGESWAKITPKPAHMNSLPYLSSSEAAVFDLFRSHVLEMAGVRSSEFWQNVVLPACHTEPAILHASMALANANRWYRPPHGKSGRDMRLDTILEYNKSIQHLKSHPVMLNTSAFVRVTLITCLLFIALELSTGRFEEAAMHLHEGRKLLLSNVGSAPSMTHHFPFEESVLLIELESHSVENTLVITFADLDLQSTYFGCQRPQLKLGIQKLTEGIYPRLPLPLTLPTGFRSMQEMDHHLVILSNKCLQFVGQKLDPELHTLQNAISNRQRQELVTSLKRWKSAYNSYSKDSHPTMKLYPAWEQHSALLLIRHSWLSAIVSTSYLEIEETDYDSYIQEFSTITNLATKILPESKTPSRGFSLEFGVVPPLSWTVLKCRNPQIRRKALHLLTCAGREGLWNPGLCAQLGREIIMLEEGVEVLDSGNESSVKWPTEEQEAMRQFIPRQRRLSGITVHLDDMDRTVVHMTFRRKIWTADGKFMGMEEIVRRRSLEAL